MAITYKILSVRQNDETVITEVEYTIGELVEVVDVPHFAPKTKEAVFTGIENRGLTIQSKVDSLATIKLILPTLIVEQGKISTVATKM